jgi:hypothetical protein
MALGMVVVAAAFGFAACGDDDEAATPTTEAPTTTVAGLEGDVTVLLSEFIVEPDPTSVPAGALTFVADNQGGEVHELVVARAESAEALPTDDDGAVDEAGLEEGALIGEIEDVAAQTQDSVDLTLDAGSYVLFCNITEEEDDGTIESHFAEGMHAAFTVT